ncbi:MAG: GLPGLI family protein [Bacteroidales bacterium]|nr:GLPGLI family protein [Bacteroidales bacterium]MCI2146346.1 GLPGLI family protein [Bacteroidales bacterium]
MNRYRLGEKKLAIDDCMLSVEYRFNFFGDTAKTKPEYDMKYLEFGHNCTRYHSVLAGRIDSLAQARDTMDIESYNAARELGLSSDQVPGWEDIYFHYPDKNSMCVSTLIVQYEYCYKGPVDTMTWTILPDKEKILGYECMKATTSYKGRDYVAWFTPDVPVSIGPWKFDNLPGLILKVWDTKGFFSWEAVGIVQPEGKKIYFKQARTVINCSRKEYAKIWRMTWEDPAQLLLSQGIRFQTVSKDDRVTEQKMGGIKTSPMPQLEIE